MLTQTSATAPAAFENVTIDMGNNESLSRGIYPQADGTFLALSFSASRDFKTYKGAVRWLARRTAR